MAIDTSDLDDELCTWPGTRSLWTRGNAVDQWPHPVTPLTQDLVLANQERGIGVAFDQELGLLDDPGPWSFAGCFYGWTCVAVEPVARMADAIPGFSAAAVYEQYFSVERDPAAPEVPRRKLVNPLPLIPLGARFARASRSFPRRIARYRDEGARQLRADRTRDWSDETDGALLERLDAAPPRITAWRVPLVLSNVIAAPQFEKVTAQLRTLDDGDGSLVPRLLGGAGGYEVGDATAALADVAAGRSSLEAFVDRYGHRGINEYELAATPWADDHDGLARLVDRVGTRSQPAGRGAQARAEALDELRARTSRSRYRRVIAKLGRLDEQMRLRENAKSHEVMLVASLRYVVREVGRRLADRGLADAPDDVFFLRPPELRTGLERGLDLHDVVTRRRRTHETAATLDLPLMLEVERGHLGPIPPERFTALGLLPPAPEPTEVQRELHGLGVAPGVVRGRARIVSDPHIAEFEAGDILVARSTDPAWTPLFLHVGAVVIDLGGPMSHGAIIARDLGIPCVINVKRGTTDLQDGATIEVDGVSGTVRVVDAATSSTG
ncbi:MAG: hypothetical protein KY469_13200 [Actinobacteria bacterium]|nr:hypothetical protein [Actinomycetota bacterium]